jgi:hypothetical protein
MGTIPRIAVVIGALVLSLASATKPQQHWFAKSATVNRPIDPVWTALIDLFADRNWAIQTMAKDSGLIVTDWMKGAEEYGDCGGSGIATTHGVQVRFNVRVKGDGAKTEVTVNASFRELRTFDGESRMVDCESKGTVEALIHREVTARAAAIKTATVSAPAPADTKLRGFFCAAAPTTGFCSREKADCGTARDAAVAAVPDLSECALVENAFCFDGEKRCFPTAEICAARAGAAKCEERR